MAKESAGTSIAAAAGLFLEGVATFADAEKFSYSARNAVILIACGAAAGSVVVWHNAEKRAIYRTLAAIAMLLVIAIATVILHSLLFSQHHIVITDRRGGPVWTYFVRASRTVTRAELIFVTEHGVPRFTILQGNDVPQLVRIAQFGDRGAIIEQFRYPQKAYIQFTLPPDVRTVDVRKTALPPEVGYVSHEEVRRKWLVNACKGGVLWLGFSAALYWSHWRSVATRRRKKF